MIIQNAVYIPENDLFLKSVDRHDFIMHKFSDNKIFFIDGGISYQRVGGDYVELIANNRIVDYSLTSDDSMESIREKLLWGTRGISGKDELRHRLISTFNVDHLKAILDNCPYASPLHKNVVEYWYNQKKLAA